MLQKGLLASKLHVASKWIGNDREWTIPVFTLLYICLLYKDEPNKNKDQADISHSLLLVQKGQRMRLMLIFKSYSVQL